MSNQYQSSPFFGKLPKHPHKVQTQLSIKFISISMSKNHHLKCVIKC
jgi:hypothetical protein